MMDRHGICAMGFMAKAPQPGRAKTRLCPPLQPAQAAELSAAFLRDITENIALAARAAPIHGHVAYAPAGAEACFAGHLAEGTGLVLADGSPPMPSDVQGFGRSLLHAAQAMLVSGFGAACLLNSDSPTLPTALLTRAAGVLLAPGERVVLGPADDGGYYLIGMKQPHARSVRRHRTGARREVCRDDPCAGLPISASSVVALPTWYDVDDAATLARLAGRRAVRGAAAVHGSAVLR